MNLLLEELAGVFPFQLERLRDHDSHLKFLIDEFEIVLHFLETIEVVLLRDHCKIAFDFLADFCPFDSVGVGLGGRVAEIYTELLSFVGIRIDDGNDIIT